MRHYYFFLIVLATLVGCSPKSNEEKVIQEFKNYAKTHFDDPSKLKEIIGIDETDTMSTVQLKEAIKEGITPLRSADSLINQYDSITSVH